MGALSLIITRFWAVYAPKIRQRPPRRPKTSATLWAPYGRLMGGKTASPKKEGGIHFCSSVLYYHLFPGSGSSKVNRIIN